MKQFINLQRDSQPGEKEVPKYINLPDQQQWQEMTMAEKSLHLNPEWKDPTMHTPITGDPHKINTIHGEVTYDSVEQLAEDFASALKALNVSQPAHAKQPHSYLTALIYQIPATGQNPSTPTPLAGKSAIETLEELWDKYSEHMDDDLDSCMQFAGQSILTRREFDKLINEYASLKDNGLREAAQDLLDNLDSFDRKRVSTMIEALRTALNTGTKQ